MLLGEPKLGRKMLAHQVAVEQRHRPAANFQELGQQRIGDGRFP